MGTTEGSTSYGDERVPDSLRPDDLARDGLVIGFAGTAAERAVLGEASAGGQTDVSGATRIALGRIDAGLTDESAPVDLEQLGRNVAETLKTDVARDLADQLIAARDRARSIVAANTDAIVRLADVLETAGELTGVALTEAIARAGFTSVAREA
jgi:ATP-dependent Zn protease